MTPQTIMSVKWIHVFKLVHFFWNTLYNPAKDMICNKSTFHSSYRNVHLLLYLTYIYFICFETIVEITLITKAINTTLDLKASVLSYCTVSWKKKRINANKTGMPHKNILLFFIIKMNFYNICCSFFTSNNSFTFLTKNNYFSKVNKCYWCGFILYYFSYCRYYGKICTTFYAYYLFSIYENMLLEQQKPPAV